ncbi:MAG TPA: iron-containing alcohol dehydrogenase [Bacteroidetes bacterium]|nr:iron-containing alcohol dehydrogenase [Bacteroidota bacterium]
MENFIAHNPTKVHFGRGVVNDLGKAASRYGNRVLFMYGKGSAVKNGYYDQVKKQLTGAGMQVAEYSGIKPNPVIDDVEKAADLGRRERSELVVALGGGSVIDSAKITALCIANDMKGWDIMTGTAEPVKTIPLIAVLTLAATGTEMNGSAVVQNPETREKLGYWNPLNFPAHSFLDPEYTYTVPEDYTAYGIADLIAHCLENFFGKGDAPLSDRFIYSIIQEALEVGPLVLKHPRNYEYRARIMWAATNALNGLTQQGKAYGDWGVHAIGHTLSFLYDTPHGATLSIAYPAWLKLHAGRIPERITTLGNNLFGVNTPARTIEEVRKMFSRLRCPLHLSDIGIDNSHKTQIVNLMHANRVTGRNYELSNADHLKLVNYMM